MAERLSRLTPGAGVALLGAFVVMVDDAVYLRLIADQRTGFDARVVFVASLLAIVAVSITVGVVRRSALLLAFATATSAALGFVALFSIGLPLLVAGGMCGSALARLPSAAKATTGLAGFLGGVAVVVGFLLIPR